MKAMFGREREMRAVEELLDGARRRYSVVIVEGEPGIGKTSVWSEAMRRGHDAGFRVLSCRPAQAEVKLAFASLSDLLQSVGDEIFAELPGPQRVALEVALLRASPGEGRPDRRAAATGLLTVLKHLTGLSPVLIAIDDAQWLDRASAAALTFAMRRIDRGQALGLLAAVRIGQAHPADVLGVRQAEAARLTVLPLGPLTTSVLHRVIAAEVGLNLPRPTLQRVAQESGGNPLFAVELARALKDCGERSVPGDPLPVPRGLAELLGARVSKLPASACTALLAAALVPNPTCDLIERCLGPDAETALERARRADLIEIHGEQIRFVHPLYATAVSSAALPGQRRALHKQLAGIVENQEERVRHLCLAATSPDEAIARALDDAAALARSRGAWDVAAELLERARELTPPQRREEARTRSISAAQHHVYAGDRPRARALIEEVLAEPLPDVLRAQALHLLGRISHQDENAAEAKRLLNEALRFTDDPVLTGAIELDLGYVNASCMEYPEACIHARRALEVAERIGDRALAAQAKAHCAMTDFLCGRGVDWDKIEQSLAVDRLDVLVPLDQRPATLAAFLLLYVGRHEEARERLTALCTTASQTGDESDLAFLLLWRSWLETRGGDFPAAAALAEESAAVAAVTGSRSIQAWALTQQAFVHAHLGAITDVRRCCATAAGPVQRSGQRLPSLWIAASLTLLELSLGDAEAAWQASAPLVEMLEQQGLGEPVIAFFLPDALEALIALGQTVRVESLLEEFEQRARELDRIWALATASRCRGLLLVERGDFSGALAALEQALVEHKRIEMPFERARTLLAMGVVQRRSGQRRKALTSLEEARGEFERMGTRVWAERAAAEAGRIPIRRSTANGWLTPTEESVADLVARGQTNREVAHALCVSEKTVESNLTRIYRKLGIRSRTALAAKMAAGTARGDGRAKP